MAPWVPRYEASIPAGQKRQLLPAKPGALPFVGSFFSPIRNRLWVIFGLGLCSFEGQGSVEHRQRNLAAHTSASVPWQQLRKLPKSVLGYGELSPLAFAVFSQGWMLRLSWLCYGWPSVPVPNVVHCSSFVKNRRIWKR